jgi:hypothetical protein
MNPSTPEPAKTACGGAINSKDAWPSATYKGKEVYFCYRHVCAPFSNLLMTSWREELSILWMKIKTCICLFAIQTALGSPGPFDSL